MPTVFCTSPLKTPTGKEQSIRITASSGLSDDEIDKMVKDAEAHADEDKKFADLVAARNHADGMISATEKSLKEMGDKVEADEKANIEAAISALQDAIKGNDKDDIEAKTTALTEVSGKLAERMYAQEGADSAAGGAGFTDAAQAASGKKAESKDDVVDAEFEEIKEK
jgi:molecular chaperone DnaK